MDVNKKYFMEKMAEWHVELEDKKPEEIHLGKSSCDISLAGGGENVRQ